LLSTSTETKERRLKKMQSSGSSSQDQQQQQQPTQKALTLNELKNAAEKAAKEREQGWGEDSAIAEDVRAHQETLARSA
jgi:hypothetical protein